jgi:hypothetical protein
MSTRRKRATRRQATQAAVSWWCLRAALVALLTLGLTEISAHVPPTWLPRKANVATVESREHAHEALVSNLHRDFGVEPASGHRIVRAAREASVASKIPVTLLLAVMAVESEFDPAARNRNDLGLMQVNLRYHPQEARNLKNARELLKIDTNVKTGARILRRYMDEEAGKVYPALRRYNGLRKPNHYPERVLMAKTRFDRVLAQARH